MSLEEAFRMTVYLANHVPSTPLGGKTPSSMWHGGTTQRLEHLRTFGARAFVHEEWYVKKLTMKVWERRMVGYGKKSKTYRIWESRTKIVESRNAFIETLPVKLNAFDHDHNDGNDDTFLDLESSSISLGTQGEMPKTEADAESDTGDSQSGGTTSNVGEEIDSDVEVESDGAVSYTHLTLPTIYSV